MMYNFYSRNDENKEAIGRVEASDFKDALKHFSEVKKLGRKQFLKLYEISNNIDGKRK